jgi:orotidine-5'-phosphate decarboxylase
MTIGAVKTTGSNRESPVIVALDVGSGREALRLVGQLKGQIGMFKVGSELFISEGPDIVRAIGEIGERVFLDLKLHDIPNTVSRAALEAAGLGASMLTIHASGGPEMIETTRDRLEDCYGEARPLLLAVTVLTSIDQGVLSRIGVEGTPDDQVLRLAQMAFNAGADGVVCSPREIRGVREKLGVNFKIVSPGVRMPSQSVDDQKRVATPRQAIDTGADWIVVGRYVNEADDPLARLEEVVRSLG